jgi:RNA polymerase sigma-70 factor (ECF subfamily)
VVEDEECDEIGKRNGKGGMKAATANEAALIARVLAGDKEVFHALIRPYEKLVYVTIFAIVKNEAEAEDGAQETMISAYRNLKSFRGEAKFSTWLVTIATNEARKRLRKARAVAEDSVDEPKEDSEGDYTPAVGRLPEKYREVFVLRDIEELNQEETAAALGINVTLVKVRLHRARMMLQKMLAPYLKSETPAREGFFRRWSQ